MVLLIGTKCIFQTFRIHKLMEKYPVLKDTSTRISIMIYQLGEFNKFFTVYARAYTHLSSAYEAEARLCLANLLIQIDLFCAAKGWNVDMLRCEGYDHLLDKIKEVETKGGEII